MRRTSSGRSEGGNGTLGPQVRLLCAQPIDCRFSAVVSPGVAVGAQASKVLSGLGGGNAWMQMASSVGVASRVALCPRSPATP